MADELNKQVFSLDLSKKVDIDKLSAGLDYLTQPKKFGMFRASDALFDSTLIRIFENGWIRIYVVSESGSYGEAMFKATESLTYLRRIISDADKILSLDVDMEKVLAGIKPISEELAMYEMLLLDVDSSRPEFKRDMSATYFRILHHSTFEKYLGATTAAKVLYSTGSEVGKVYSAIYSAKDLSSFLSGLKKFMEYEKIAKITVLSSDENLVRIRSDESMTSAGIPSIARPVCHFERGFIGGAISGYTGKPTDVTETRCWGLGDTYCEFEVRLGG